MNERMNEFPSISEIFNSGRSSAALWCQKLELQIQIPGEKMQDAKGPTSLVSRILFHVASTTTRL